MELKRIAMIFAFVMLFLSQAYALELFYNASMNTELNKQQFAPGESLEAEITVLNLEDFPIAEAYVVVELVQGKDYYYPSQTTDRDNVFFEEKILGLNIAPYGKAATTFSYTIPDDLTPGDYRIDVYAKTNKTHLVGAPHIFASPNSVNFTVSGRDGSFPEAKFVRTKTRFHQFLGPIGPGISPGEEIENEIFVQNTSGRNLSDLTLFVGMCEWDDTSCKSFNSSATKKISSLKAGDETKVSVKLTSPQMPDAYAIRLELKDSDGKLLSLYRNRSIVYGGTAKIHQLNVSDYLFGESDNVELSVLIGPSPDHYTFPEFNDFAVRAWVEDIRDNNRVVFSESKAIDSISGSELKQETFSFASPVALDLFKVCAVIEKQGIEHEHYCYVVDASKFPEKKQMSEIDVQWNYDFSVRELNLSFSNKDPGASKLNAAFLLMDFASNDLLASAELKGSSPTSETVETEPGNFVLLLNNFSTGRQKRVNINLEGEATALSLKTCTELGGILCGSGQLCNNKVASSESGVCCLTECRERLSIGQLGFDLQNLFSILFWIVVILIVLIIAYNAYNRVIKGKEKRVAGEIVEKHLR